MNKDHHIRNASLILTLADKIAPRELEVVSV